MSSFMPHSAAPGALSWAFTLVVAAAVLGLGRAFNIGVLAKRPVCGELSIVGQECRSDP